MRAAPLIALLLIALSSSCRGGCGRAPTEARPFGGRLALFPIETRSVVALDLVQLRSAPAAAKLAALTLGSPADEQRLQVFRERTGLDPARQLNSVVVAFPADARARGELGILVRASHFDEPRLIAYARDTLQPSGDDLVPTSHGRRTLWSTRKDPDLAGFFLDDKTLVVGGGGWATKIADLADGAPASRSAATDVELAQACETMAASHAIWAAAIVPEALRAQLRGDPRLAGAASVTHMALGIDLGTGLQAAFTADLADAKEATAMVEKVAETLRGAKRDPRVLMLGLGPELDAITSKADGTGFIMRLALNEAQVGDLLDRAAAFLTLMRQGRAPGFGR
jgi:hypothetical protein